MTLGLTKISDFVTNMAARHTNSPLLLVSGFLDCRAALNNLTIPPQASLKETASLKLLLRDSHGWQLTCPLTASGGWIQTDTCSYGS